MDLMNIEIVNLVKFNQAIIEFDNSEFMAAATKLTDKYNGLIITEDMLISIGKERASLNKIVNSLDDARKKIKAEYNAPLLEFEAKIKDVSNIILKTISSLDKETKVFEEKRKNDKLIQVKDLIEKVLLVAKLTPKYAAQLTELDKYLNKTETPKKILDDLEARAAQLAIMQENEILAEEARKEKVKNRELLIENLNAKYGESFKFSQFEPSAYTDEDVQNFYASLVKESPKEIKADIVHIPCSINDKIIETPTIKSELPSRTIKISGAKLENIDIIINYIKSKGYTVEVLNV